MDRTNVYLLNPPRARPNSATEVVDHLIATALKSGASDIHIGTAVQPGSQDVYLIRYRIHGKLQVAKGDILSGIYREVVSRIKVLASLNVSDNTIPQDGQISLSAAGSIVVLRVSTVPAGGESEEVTIRVQRPDSRKYTLDEFIMRAEMRNKLNLLTQQKSGLIVVSGPAGAGKTTLVYSLLNAIASPDKKIVTAEDPIELRLPYVSHTQTTAKTNFNVLSRAFMRQDADVIFIGEVRDAESASAALQLAQTGHLVVTTLHTRDSIGVISRLEAFDLHPNFIASSLIGSINIRLAQQLCPECRQETKLEDKILAVTSRILPPPAGTKYHKAGPGCPKCTGGYIGRMPILELFMPDADISDMINRRAPKLTITENARRKGMKSMAEDALVRVYNGLVDLDSVYGYVFTADQPG